MTKIPIEKKKGVAWWIWLLVAALVLVGAWLLLGLFTDDGDDIDAADSASTAAETATGSPDEEEDENGDSATGGPSPTEAGPITDLAVLLGTADAASLAGQQVELQVPGMVQSVVGDKTFWVGPGQEQQVFVYLEETTDPAGVEGLVDVNEGQGVLITGTVEQLPPLEQARQQFELDEENSATLAEEQIYIHAEQVEVVQG